jgi:hypothetical protein
VQVQKLSPSFERREKASLDAFIPEREGLSLIPRKGLTAIENPALGVHCSPCMIGFPEASGPILIRGQKRK